MGTWTEQIPFVGPADSNPLTAVIIAVEEVQGKFSKNPRLTLEIAPGERRIMDVFDRKEIAKLIRAFGADDRAWIGKRLQILTEERVGEKPRRTIAIF